jgi:hypothetical protein
MLNFNSVDIELKVFSDSVQYTSSSGNAHIRASSSPGDKKQVLRGNWLYLIGLKTIGLKGDWPKVVSCF